MAVGFVGTLAGSYLCICVACFLQPQSQPPMEVQDVVTMPLLWPTVSRIAAAATSGVAPFLPQQVPEARSAVATPQAGTLHRVATNLQATHRAMRTVPCTNIKEAPIPFLAIARTNICGDLDGFCSPVFNGIRENSAAGAVLMPIVA